MNRPSPITRASALTLLLLTAAAALAQPPQPVRCIAEWEPAVGTLISYPFEIPQDLVVELARDDQLFVLARNQGDENTARNTLSAWGVDLGQVEFIRTPVQTEWTRDWGPHQIFDANGDWCIIDPIFEGYPWVDPPCVPITSPGGYTGDNAVNIDVAAHFGCPLHSLPAYLTGGNFLVDGFTSAFSTCAMIGENNQLWTETQFLDLAQQYVGISNYTILDNTENHGIQHIDCWFKPLNEETLLVKRVPDWHEEYSRIEANLAVLQSLTNAWGRPYQIIRIDCPPYDGYNVAAYTNSLILNTKVLVPLFNIPGDTDALQTYADALPGYDIIGFPWSSWYYYDALHCRTRAIFDRYMLRLAHMHLDQDVAPNQPLPIQVYIDDRSEAGLRLGECQVYYRTLGNADWNTIPLTALPTPDWYTASIPALAPGQSIEYYISAADETDRVETLPRSAPVGTYVVNAAEVGLQITAVDPPEMIPPWNPATFTVTIETGNEELVPGTALLHYRYFGQDFQTAPLAHVADDEYAATLEHALCDDLAQFYVSADGSLTGTHTDPPGAPTALFSATVGTLSTATLFNAGFETGLPAGWSTTGLWHITGDCPLAPPCEGTQWMYYGRDDTCTYDTGAHTFGSLLTPSLSIPEVPANGQVLLQYCSALVTEDDDNYDLARVLVNGYHYVDYVTDSADWETRTVNLSAWAGQDIDVRWYFDSLDDYYNGYPGWQVDDIRLTYTETDCTLDIPFSIGDLDCDGAINFDDIDPFVAALVGRAAYEADYPHCPWTLADCNSDGNVNFDDIDAFVTLLAQP